MERLTRIGSKGEIWIVDNDETRRLGRKEAAYKKLTEYEEHEEQGLLLKLPCKVGDTVYLIDDIDNVFDRVSVVTGIEIDVDTVYIMISDGPETSSSSSYGVDDFGKTVFLTQAEAEEALKRMGREENQ
uniref:Uncharacterized protein n=1 Tax=Dulem virus 39 TaxID=3145757 RepID=A0AAU8B5J9_9CAUD